MDSLARLIEGAVREAENEITKQILEIDLDSLLTIDLNSVTCCDVLPRGTSSLYFLHHGEHGLLYVGEGQMPET
jgi:hypothetical protein